MVAKHKKFGCLLFAVLVSCTGVAVATDDDLTSSNDGFIGQDCDDDTITSSNDGFIGQPCPTVKHAHARKSYSPAWLLS